MTTDRDQFPKHFTFSQRNGYEELPEPMKLGQLSNDLRRELCNAVRRLLLKMSEEVPNGDQYQKDFIVCTFGKFLRILKSEIAGKLYSYDFFKEIESILMNANFNHVLDFLEIVFSEMKFQNTTSIRSNFASKVQKLFNKHAAPYWLDTSQCPYWFFLLTSQEEGVAVQQAMKTLCQGGMSGAVTHLRKAAKFINAGEHADSIRESIHAVESVACTIDPSSRETLENKGLPAVTESN